MVVQTQTQPQQMDLAVRSNNTALSTTEKARELAQRLKFMIVNGNKLSDNEVYALAQYSAATDLNPFAQECYYLPGIGPGPGIAGWKKKAQEQLDWEAGKEGLTGAHYWWDKREAIPGEAVFDPAKGDIAIVVILHDWLTNRRWRMGLFETARELKEFGHPTPYEEAQRLVGQEPVWLGIGVVFGSENFGKDTFNRKERAEKRALKLALRKRFPRVHLPEPSQDFDVSQAVTVEAREIFQEPERPQKSEGQLLHELGYDPEPEPKTQAVSQSPVETNDDDGYTTPDFGSPTTEPASQPAIAVKPWTNQSITLEMAMTESSKEDGKYWDMETVTITNKLNGIQKTLEKNHLSDDELERYSFKRDVMRAILQYRAQSQSAQEALL